MGKKEAITNEIISNLLREVNIKYTPEGSNIKEINNALKTASKHKTEHTGFPDFTAKVNDFILLIENKANLNKQSKYSEKNPDKLDMTTDSIVNYAENGALHYAQHIIKNTSFKKVFAFGCSGDEKHHTIRPIFVNEDSYELLPEIENFMNFNEENIQKYYEEFVLKETPVEILEKTEVMEKAKDLHEYLRNYSQLRETEYSLVVSAIILALDKEKEIVSRLKSGKDPSDGEIIYETINYKLKDIKIPPNKKTILLDQFRIIKQDTNLNTVNKDLGESPLKFFTKFISSYVYESSINNDTDILGGFYNQFVKYSGGDGQSLGIVLTPPHITNLFCDLINLEPDDIVFDPCCGTGSFLVSAMNHMIDKANSTNQINNIKKNQLHGIESRNDMFSVATTNMILRGDGKSNLILGNFLNYTPDKLREKKFTVGFMNPPYSQRKNKETAHLSEIHFVKHLLDSLTKGGDCVVIVPQSAMVGKNTEDKLIKKEILKNHTLHGVITLNNDTTFYNIGTHPCIAVFTAHQPHSPEKRCKFINFEDDGLELRKHTGIVKTSRFDERKKHLLQCWRDEKDVESKFAVKTTIKDSDEWLHSFYYFNDEIPHEKKFIRTMQEYLSFEFDMITQNKEYLFKERINTLEYKEIEEFNERKWELVTVDFLFDVRGSKTTPLKELETKKETDIEYPYVTTKSGFMGIDGFFNYYTEEGNVITVDSATNGNIHYQGINFSASDHVEKLIPKFDMNYYIAQFIVSSLKFAIKGKFNYGYKFNQNRIKRQTFLLPVNSKNEIDFEYMEQCMINLESKLINKYLKFLKI